MGERKDPKIPKDFDHKRFCWRCGMRWNLCKGHDPLPEEPTVKVGWFGLLGFKVRIQTEKFHPLKWLKSRRERLRREAQERKNNSEEN